MEIKIPAEARTFETRLKYLREVYMHKFTSEEILRMSIEYRLNKTYEQYLEDLNNCIQALVNKNKPTQVLKRID